MERLGFIGTGGMGGPMAANLMKAGYKLTVLDLRREATKSLEEKGAAYASSPRAVAEASEVVLSMLPFGEAVREVGLGKNGLVEAGSGARIWIDLSSVEEQAIVEAEKILKPKGWTVIDATVGGVEEYAAAGELSIKVAGDKAAVDRIQPLLEPMGKKITYCGALGNAKLVKTATAMHAAVQTMATVEIFNWLKSCGVSEEVTHEAFKDSQSWSVSIQRNCEAILAKKFKPRKSWMPKDIGFGLDNAQERGVPLPFTALARQLFNVARSNGMDGYEAIGIAYKVYELLGMGEKPE
ncbi:MAG TPA: NAD(P)-dependent oxidoreductase [bacterium]|nr:NAD(P)-dependent oxidoreductase [bacterium]